MSDWERFFDGFATRYDDEVFTKNTVPEVRFIVEHLRPPPGGTVLDLGCGTGRHSVELARQGYQVTGVDLSSGMLEVAAKRAAAAGVTVEWVHQNAAAFDRPASFDAAICLCEGAICLLGADDDPMERDVVILRNVFAALRPGGKFLLNVLNACRQIRLFNDEDVVSGRFDVNTLSERSDAVAYAGEEASGYEVRERGYTVPEIRRMAAWVGFDVLGVYGGTAGSWNLEPPKLDEFELMLLAVKTG
jgi:SAM-dependent methyltransferase